MHSFIQKIESFLLKVFCSELTTADFNRLFKLAVDASDVAVGAVLLQESPDGVDYPVGYFSRKLSKCQKNHSTIEKELLELILALQHFDVYFTSTSSPVVVFSDHSPLMFRHQLKDKSQRLPRWSLLLQENNLELDTSTGRTN